MLSAVSAASALKLSICITTFNRAELIGPTLESIFPQLTDACEVVVLDGASTDNTARLLSEYACHFSRLRYIRQETNCGIDQDYDRAVDIARGEYCWLLTDDDPLKPGAVAAVLEALREDISMVLVNTEITDFSLSKVLRHRWLDFESDRAYSAREMDRLFIETQALLQYIGAIVIKKSIWVARDRQRYYGSLFIHVGVIFQEQLPGEVLLIAEPFISHRAGNTHTFSSKASEIIFSKWPALVSSLALSEATKNAAHGQPWRRLFPLLLLRGMGLYSINEYRRWVRPALFSMRKKVGPTLVSVFPGSLVNALFVSYYSMRRDRGRQLLWMKESRFYCRNWRIFRLIKLNMLRSQAGRSS